MLAGIINSQKGFPAIDDKMNKNKGKPPIKAIDRIMPLIHFF